MASSTGGNDSEFKIPTQTVDWLVSSILNTIPSDFSARWRGLCAAGFSHAVDQLMCGTRPDDLSYADIVSGSFTYPQLRKRHPKFFNVIVTFALSVRNEEDLMSLERRFYPCQCNLSDPQARSLHRQLHDDSRVESKGFLRGLAGGILMLLIAIASLSSEALYRSVEVGRKSHNKRATIALKEASQFILQETWTPQTLHAACCWYKTTKHSLILIFIRHCVEHHTTPFTGPACALEADDFLLVVCLELRELILSMKRDPTSVTTSHPTAMHNFLGFALQMTHKFPGHTCGPLIWDIASIYFVDVIDSLDSSCLDILSKGGITTLLGGVAISAVHCKTAGLPNADKILSYCHSADHVLGTTKLPYLDVWSLIVLAYDRKQCANPLCGISPQAHRFPKCARCSIPSYCSRKCQLEAWSLPDCPHRAFCKALGGLLKYWPISNPEARAGLPLVEAADLLNNELKKLLDPAEIPETLIARMPDYFGALKQMAREKCDEAEAAALMLAEMSVEPDIDESDEGGDAQTAAKS